MHLGRCSSEAVTITGVLMSLRQALNYFPQDAPRKTIALAA